jgi:hypothetical protein
VTGIDRLGLKDRRQLTRWLLDGGDETAEITGQEWLALLYVFTRHLTQTPTEVPGDEWADLSDAFDVALRMTPYGTFDAVSRRFNLMSVLLRSLPPRTGVSLLDPDAAARLFLDVLPMSREEAVRLSADWQREDIADMRRMRWIKNMLTPLKRFSHLIGDRDLAARVAEWIELRDRLP